MRQLVLFILSLLLYDNLMFAQSRRSIRVKAGEDIAQAYSHHGFYHFPQFSKAVLFFKDGRQNAGLLFNYNILSGTMQFINPAGDTLDISVPESIDSIVFEKNVFVQNKGFIEVAAHTDSIMLLKKIIIKTQVEKIGGYGQPTQTASIDNINSYSTGTNVYNFIINEDVIVTENVYWYWMDKKKNILKATKVNFLKLLPPGKLSIAEAYMKQNKINFEKETDLKELMTDNIAGHK